MAIWATEPNQSLLLLLRMPAEKLITTSSSRVGSLSARDQDETSIHSPIYYVQGRTRLTLVSTDLQKLFNRPGTKAALMRGVGGWGNVPPLVREGWYGSFPQLPLQRETSYGSKREEGGKKQYKMWTRKKRHDFILMTK